MKNIKKILSMVLALTLCLSFPLSASAVEPEDPTDGVLIDEDALGSLTLYMYDLTNGATRS